MITSSAIQRQLRAVESGPEPYFNGSSRSFGPGAAYASMARPTTRARSSIDRLRSFRPFGPGAVYALMAMARPVTGPGADRTGSSSHPGPEPYQLQWLVLLLQAHSRNMRTQGGACVRSHRVPSGGA